MNHKKLLYCVFSFGFAVLIASSMYLGYAGEKSVINKEENINNNNNNNKPIQIVKQAKNPVAGLLIGYDKSGKLTDVLMVGYLDQKKNLFRLISLPRDLIIDFREEPFKTIKDNNPNNRLLYCKLNEVYCSLGHDDRAREDVQKIISEIIGMDIDYYVNVNINIFKEIVDSVGGVEFDVPQRMYYKDPFQNLFIDLQPGVQLLKGDKAEQLVRFRRYTFGDLQRIQVQQEFISKLADKILSTNNYKSIKNIIEIVFDTVQTDVKSNAALEYAIYFYKNKENHLLDKNNMMTVESYGEKIDGIWYQKWNKDEIREAVKLFINPELEEKQEIEETETIEEKTDEN